MRIAWIMFKKEIIENYKKNRFLILGAIFLLFGIMSPLTAKYLPEILKFIMGSEQEVAKLGIQIPVPTILDSYSQFYKNLSQMGIFVQIIIFMNLVSDEKSKGTVVLVLTKAVPRSTFLLSKFVAACIVLISSLALSSIGFYYYTFMLFGEFPSSGTMTGIGLFLLFSVFILAFTFFASTVTKTTSISALISIGGYFLLSIFSILPKISDYLPLKLADASYQISAAAHNIEFYSKSIVVTIVGIVLFIVISILSFQKQEL
ncbi:MAG: ABC transporter permease [Saccharofermentanales bacterium]